MRGHFAPTPTFTNLNDDCDDDFDDCADGADDDPHNVNDNFGMSWTTIYIPKL